VYHLTIVLQASTNLTFPLGKKANETTDPSENEEVIVKIGDNTLQLLEVVGRGKKDWLTNFISFKLLIYL
jgi:hypothetical protein